MREELLNKLRDMIAEEERLAGENPDRESHILQEGFVFDSDKLLAKGSLIALRPHARFGAVPEHSHNYVEIMYMCAGRTRHRVNDGPELTLEAGELLFLNQHARHSVEWAGEGDLGVNLIVLPQFFDYAFTMIGTGNPLATFILDGLRRSGGDLSCLHFRVSGRPQVQNLVENLLWSLAFQRPGSGKVEQATMGLLLLQLLEELDGLSPENTGHSGPVLAALREIQDNYRQADLTRLARELHVSLPYLSSAIHAATGKTFKELLLEKRMARAAQLLLDTSLPVEDIITAVGYDNTSYFYRKFRQSFGVSPRKYRLGGFLKKAP